MICDLLFAVQCIDDAQDMLDRYAKIKHFGYSFTLGRLHQNINDLIDRLYGSAFYTNKPASREVRGVRAHIYKVNAILNKKRIDEMRRGRV